jgi:glucose-1-phosphate cytidylyltransferase
MMATTEPRTLAIRRVNWTALRYYRRCMKAVILAGGLGTRLMEETELRPKPMVEIGGRPLLWHILKHYAHFGLREFVIALGYRGELIKRYFTDAAGLDGSVSVHTRARRVERHDEAAEDWIVRLIETGLDTMTGGRLKRLAPHVSDGTFMMTYGDGVADVDLHALLAFHREHGCLATITAVRPPARFGALEIEGDHVVRFSEKPQVTEGWINGGFFVLEPRVLDYIEGDQTLWERQPLERLAKEGQVVAFRHESFWQGMDTLRDRRYLESIWAAGKAPWKVWE